jgi:hypothetical protein
MSPDGTNHTTTLVIKCATDLNTCKVSLTIVLLLVFIDSVAPIELRCFCKLGTRLALPRIGTQ